MRLPTMRLSAWIGRILSEIYGNPRDEKHEREPGQQ